MNRNSRRRLSCSCNGIIFIYVILACTSSIHGSRPPACGLYGAPPCQFLPAPPGQTPTCARPGKTYCEHIDNYPTYLIKHLIQKWGYEARNLIVDETWEDFAAVAWHETPVFYDPKSIFPSRDFHGDGNDFGGYNYNTPPYGNSAGGTVDSTASSVAGNSLFISKPLQATESPPTYLLYTSAGQRLNYNKPPTAASGGGHLYYSNKSTPYNATLWLKRIARDLSQKNAPTKPDNNVEGGEAEKAVKDETLERSTRDVSINMDLLDIVGVAPDSENTKKTRTKRQSPGRSTLCQTTSQFITPQAALNSRGNWMFVVNEENTARQMVKAELCASNTCSNLCELPNGYNSRCEQKFVQKRLIALQGNGQNLYTDSFWFPSCCVCTIAAN